MSAESSPSFTSAYGSLSHIQWRATEWLIAFGPLSVDNVMDYFVLSPFFDRTSNNAVLRMQMQYSRGGMLGVDEEAELRKFVGQQYCVVQSSAPSLFVIHKQDRKDFFSATTIAAYYILNDSIYQSPTLYTVINERLLTAIHALGSSLELFRSKKPLWSPEHVHAWQIGSDDEALGLHHGTSVGRQAHDEAKKEGSKNGEKISEIASETFNPLLFEALRSMASFSSAREKASLVNESARQFSGVDQEPSIEFKTQSSAVSKHDGHAKAEESSSTSSRKPRLPKKKQITLSP